MQSMLRTSVKGVFTWLESDAGSRNEHQFATEERLSGSLTSAVLHASRARDFGKEDEDKYPPGIQGNVRQILRPSNATRKPAQDFGK